MSFDYFSQRRMQYILEKLKAIFDTKADSSDIPTVGDGTLTIKRNGSTVQSFSANSDTDVNADIEVPEVWTGTMAEYIQQASQIADGTQINITDDFANGVPVGLADIYSTEERQIGVYTDGKPLYQKTFLYNSVTGGDNTYYFNFANDVIIREQKNSFFAGNMLFIDNSISQNNIDVINTDYERTVINIASVLAPYLDGVAITVKYTKTTDTAGSGIWTPSGAQAVHYSTTEQVVGDYMGEPLYGRIIDNISVSIADTSWTQVASIPNGKDIINLTVWMYVSEYALINYNQARLDSTTGILYVRFTSDVVGRTVYRVYAEYTKTIT